MKKTIDITDDDMMGEVPLPEQSEKNLEHLDRAQLQEKLDQAEAKALTERLEIDTLNEKLKMTENKLLHALADIDNVQRRSEQRIIDAHKYGISKLLEALIPVLDSLEQSQAIALPEPVNDTVKNMHAGMALTLQMLLNTLGKFGVAEINPVIQQDVFSPALHEVIFAQEMPEITPNTIIQVMQKGYQLSDRLIRPARVVISKMPA